MSPPPDDRLSPFARFLDRQGFVVLDGGLATALEGRGLSLGTKLWSARLLLDAPDTVRDVHREYLEAGADCIATASYQATLLGFREIGLDDEEGRELLLRSVRLALEARDAFWADPGNRAGRLRPVVAGSIGPYGAYLADGSEYDGRYGLTDSELEDFHRDRFRILAGSEVDLLGLETIPSLPEARALLTLLDEAPGRWAWISFSCRDGRHLADGSTLAEAVRACGTAERLAGVGVNCVAPEHVPELIAELSAVTSRPIVVYPNSGEEYDASLKAWRGEPSVTDWGAASDTWAQAGARVVGGCCRVGPREIGTIRRRLLAG